MVEQLDFPEDVDGDRGFIGVPSEEHYVHISRREVAVIDVNDEEVYLTRESLKDLFEWAKARLEETKVALPTRPYAVIDAVVDYGNGPYKLRLVHVPNDTLPENRLWVDPELNDHNPTHFVDFTVLSEGIDL